MKEDIKSVYAPTREAWRDWLKKNHLKEQKVHFIKYKKHTGKPGVHPAEAMREAICFGWIDTTAKRLDEDRFMITYVRRSSKSRWSNNTLRYAKELIKEKKMSPHGLKMYKEGLAKPTIDSGVPKNPDTPEDLKKALARSKKARENFEKMAPSYRRVYISWIVRAKMPETRKRRIKAVVQRAYENKRWGQ